MLADLRLTLHPHVRTSSEDGRIVLRWNDLALTVAARAGLAAAVRDMADPGVVWRHVVRRQIGGASGMHLAALVRRLDRLGWLSYRLDDGDRTVVEAVPVAPPAGSAGSDPAGGGPAGFHPAASGLSWDGPEAVGPYRLSRFAYGRWSGDRFALRSPLSPFEVTITDPALVALVTGTDGADVDPGLRRRTLRLLRYARLVCAVRPDGGTDEDDDEALRQWEFHDLLFHAYTRDGRDRRPSGGTFRFAGAIEPLPAVRPPHPGAGHTVALERPDTDVAGAMSLFEALDRRRSVREQGEIPIGRRQLGEFLYRCARTTFVMPTDGGEVGRRPYPGGGGLHELELYVLVDRSTDVERGLYHYRTAEHRLLRVADPGPDGDALLDDAAYSTASGRPQVLVVVAARFQRVSWKYEAIAYALMLKNLGCLLQTMYLTATAMGLAPCAVGGGNAETFARLTGIPALVEGSIGEFVLGTRPTGPATRVE